jgi:2-amino-4-hydroxy-6-hydroxymethyldihydropteridine diphosphokinase
MSESTAHVVDGRGSAFVALGSNLGERIDYLRAAVEFFDAANAIVIDTSQVYETDPVGGPDQGTYLNAVMQVMWAGSPHDLLQIARGAEEAAERVRGVHWGPRTLDVDIIAMHDAAGPVLVSGADLELPHPRAHERAFVLLPLADVAPELELPPHGTVTDLVAALTPAQLAGVRLTTAHFTP